MVVRSSKTVYFNFFATICLCVTTVLADEKLAIEKLDANSGFGSYTVDEQGHAVNLELDHVAQFLELNSGDVCELISQLPLMPKLYKDPQRPTKPAHTVYQAAIGQMTLLRATERSSLAQATNGLQNTITLVETSSESAVPWTSPQDYEVDLKNPYRDLIQNGVGLAALADENFRTFDEHLAPEILRAYFTRDAND